MKQLIASPNEVRLGMEVEEIKSGVRGIVDARVEYMNGCVQFRIAPKADKDGKVPDAWYWDWQTLHILGPGISVELQQHTKPAATDNRGGPETQVRSR